jgi:hypothetical protein
MQGIVTVHKYTRIPSKFKRITLKNKRNLSQFVNIHKSMQVGRTTSKKEKENGGTCFNSWAYVNLGKC